MAILLRNLTFGVIGIIFSQVTVLAIWAALGRSPIMWRAVATVSGSSVLGLALCACIGEMQFEWFVLVWIVALVTMAGFLVLRWLRFELVNINLFRTVYDGRIADRRVVLRPVDNRPGKRAIADPCPPPPHSGVTLAPVDGVGWWHTMLVVDHVAGHANLDAGSSCRDILRTGDAA